MIYEFALDPELVARWHDRKEYLFFEEKFGIRSRRLISTYPKNWKKLVWKAFEKCPAAQDQNAQARLTELVKFLWENSIKRPSTFPEIFVWLDRAEAEHSERPFHAIVATKNPRNQPFVISAQHFVENGHQHWVIPTEYPTPRNAYDIAGALAPITRVCRRAVLVDPYFAPDKKRFQQSIKAILSSFRDNVFGMGKVQVELHTSIDRFFEDWEKEDNRDEKAEKKVYGHFIDICKKGMPELVPEGMNLRLVIWKERNGGKKLHNRYLLTDNFGVMFGTGIDEATNPDSKESDDIVALEEGQYCIRCQQYSEFASAFKIVGKPFVIDGKSV